MILNVLRMYRSNYTEKRIYNLSCFRHYCYCLKASGAYYVSFSQYVHYEILIKTFGHILLIQRFEKQFWLSYGLCVETLFALFFADHKIAMSWQIIFRKTLTAILRQLL